MKKCPFCAEEIQSEAIKCKFCSSDLTTEQAKLKTNQQMNKDRLQQEMERKKVLHNEILGRTAFSGKVRSYLLSHADYYATIKQKNDDEIIEMTEEKIRKNSILWIYIIAGVLTFFGFGTIFVFATIVAIWLHPRKGQYFLALKDRFVNWSQYKMRIWLSVGLFCFLGLINIGIKAGESQKITEREEANKQEIAEQKLIEAEKQKYSQPVITIKSPAGQQKNGSYTLIFSCTGAEIIKVNGKEMTGTGGEFSIPMQIELPILGIKIIAKNKYYSAEQSIAVSRPKTKAEIEADKVAESERKLQEKLLETKAKQEKAAKLFSAWDGSLPSLVRSVENAMNNPDSFEHVSTKWGFQTDKKLGDVLRVRMNYRGTNAFGAIVTNSILVETDMEGNILKVLE